MKILFNLGTLRKGGAERVVTNLSNYLSKDNNEISIVTSVAKEKSYYKINDEVKIYGLDEKNKNENFLTKNINRIMRLNDIIKNINPDVIVSFLPEPSYRVLFLKLLNRKLKVIVSVRNDPKIEYKNKINRLVMKILYPLADGFVFQTQEAKEYFNKKIQDKSVIIPNPLNEEFIHAIINKNKNKVIINVGRLEEQKNQEMLIKAFSEVCKKHPEYKLVIYGEGSLREKLTNLISKLDLQNKVFLPGNVDDVIEKLNEAEIFVLSSHYEGMPNALMEAMAMGVACISTDCPCGGPKFLIRQNENGILIKNDDYMELSEKIEYLVENENVRDKISSNATKIREDLNPIKINLSWKQFIEKNRGI